MRSPICRYCGGDLADAERYVRPDGQTENFHGALCRRAYWAERKAASRARLRGEPDAEPRGKGGRMPNLAPCQAPGCDLRQISRGMCNKHYTKSRSRGLLLVGR